MREIRTLRLTGRGLETGLRRSYTGTKLETADTAKGSLRGTAPALDPTRYRVRQIRLNVVPLLRHLVLVQQYFHLLAHDVISFPIWLTSNKRYVKCHSLSRPG